MLHSQIIVIHLCPPATHTFLTQCHMELRFETHYVLVCEGPLSPEKAHSFKSWAKFLVTVLYYYKLLG